jgi:hypothetical protein
VEKKGRRPSEIEMMKAQLKNIPKSDSEDEKVGSLVRIFFFPDFSYLQIPYKNMDNFRKCPLQSRKILRLQD